MMNRLTMPLVAACLVAGTGAARAQYVTPAVPIDILTEASTAEVTENPSPDLTDAIADADPDEPGVQPYFTWGNRKFFIGLDVSFVSYVDNSHHASMGRERQMVPARTIISLYGDYSTHISFRLEANPVNRSLTPRPYIPHESDRRTYFFPNQPDVAGGRGVASQPEGLFYVDDYKTLGVDPIHNLGGLRVGYADFHTASQRFGVQAGRVYVPQGLGLDRTTWFSAKDLVHMQIIDAAADDGVLFYYQTGRVRVEAAGLTGNASPFHDYGYFDFTATGEDKNSALATVGRVTVEPVHGLVVGASAKHNYVNSRIEDATTLQLSKRYDNALTGFVHWRQSPYLSVYGQVSRYKWGQRDTSAALMPGPQPETPVFKHGYFAGAEVATPRLRMLRGAWLSAGYTRSELDRDDSLVSWAAANNLFGVTMGKKERSNVFRVQGHVTGNVSVFWFLHDLSNPFPELSAIQPIAGPGSDTRANNNKSGMGLTLKF